MSTVTKTYTSNENFSSAYKKTWNVTYNFSDKTLNSSTFTFTTPTITAKFTGTKGLYRSTFINANFYTDKNKNYEIKPKNQSSHAYEFVYANPAHDSSNYILGSSGASFTMTKRTEDFATAGDNLAYSTHSFSYDTSDIFNDRNSNSITQDIYMAGYIALSTNTQKDGEGDWGDYLDDLNLFKVGTLTLNAPPSIEQLTVQSTGPYYNGFSEYTVNVNNGQAYYEGTITKCKLVVGSNSVTSTSIQSDGTFFGNLTAPLSTVGTFIPQVEITDTRGQVKTYTLPEIVVHPYENPTINYKVERSTQAGITKDEGKYGLITANVTFLSSLSNCNLIEPIVTVKDSANQEVNTTITWYKTYSQSGVSEQITNWGTDITNSPVPIYGIASASIADGFDPSQNYTFSITIKDNNNKSSETVSYTMPSAFYMMDFRAGGHGMAIGKASTRDGLEIRFPTMIGQGLSTPLLQSGEIDISKYQLVIGKYNEVVEDAIFVIGAGSSDNPSNVFVIDENGNLTLRSRQDSNSDRYTGLNINHNPYIDDDGLGNITTYDVSAGVLASVLNYTSGNITYQHTASLSVSSNEYPTMGNTVQLDTKTYNTTQSTPVALKTANLTLRTTSTESYIEARADNMFLDGNGNLKLYGNLTLADHSSPIGSVYEHTASSVSLTSTAAQDQDTGKTILSCTDSHIVPAGCWVGFIYVNFSAGASTVVGFNMSTSNTSAAWSTQMHASELNYGTRIRQPVIISIANDTAYYVRAWSREGCTVNTVTVRLMRIK